MDNGIIIGADVGKTNISVGVFDDSFRLIDFQTLQSAESADRIINILDATIRDKTMRYKANQLRGIGIASFGIVNSKQGVVLESKFVHGWNNIYLKKFFEDSFHVPVYVENDVKAALLGECFAMEQQTNIDKGIIYFSVGTTIGFAYYYNGAIVRGCNGKFGEIFSYIPYDEKTSLGDIIGGKGISNQYKKLTGKILSAEHIYKLSTNGDTIADTLWIHMVQRTVRVLDLLNVYFDPSAIILGGGIICNNPDLYKIISTKFNSLPSVVTDNLCRAKLGTKSGVYGAGRLAWKMQTQNLSEICVENE